MVTQNQNSEIGLVNGGIVEFAGFHGDEVSWDSSDGKLLYPPPYMLVQIVEGPGSDVQLPNLAKGVVSLTSVKFTINDILTSFDDRELMVPLFDHLNTELKSEKTMNEKTIKTFGHL